MNEKLLGEKGFGKDSGTPPGLDIFYTPDNENFYERGPYMKLDPIQHEIRLLKLLPDTGQELMACELLEKAPLSDLRGKYTALSYCAGDPKRTQTILVNGVLFEVFANLGHALFEARKFWSKSFPGREFFLWVDQICINQKDFTERSHQVGFMRDIYQLAEQVLVCLSIGECSSAGIDWLVNFSEAVPITLEDIRQGNMELMRRGDLNYDFSSRLSKFIFDNTHDKKFMSGWLALYDVFESPWWKRAWVYQEFIVSSEAYFMFGSASFCWNSLEAFLYAFFERKFQGMYMLGDFQLRKEERRLGSDNPEFRRLCGISDRWKELEQSTAMKAVEFMITRKRFWSRTSTGSEDLKKLLRSSRHCVSSDPRDMVFAFLGLADPHYAILIDYSTENGIVDVLIETTKRIILFEDSLDVLAHTALCRGLNNSLPSWVPDWTCRDAPDLLHDKAAFLTRLSACKGRKANAKFRNSSKAEGVSSVLEADGVFVGGLTKEFYWNGSRKGTGSRSFESSEGHIVKSTDLAQVSDQLWVLFGAKSPFILRKTNIGYHLVGEAKVEYLLTSKDLSDIHGGDVMNLVEKGIMQPQRISIH